MVARSHLKAITLVSIATNSSKWVIVSIRLSQVFLVVSLYSAAAVFWFVLIWSQWQDTRSFICPVIGFQNDPLQAFGSCIRESPTDLHAWSAAAAARSSIDHISLLEDLGWVTSWCGWWGQAVSAAAGSKIKTKPQMCLTPSADYFLFVILIWQNPETMIFTIMTQILFIWLDRNRN